jgi:hypothetical protein
MHLFSWAWEEHSTSLRCENESGRENARGYGCDRDCAKQLRRRADRLRWMHRLVLVPSLLRFSCLGLRHF